MGSSSTSSSSPVEPVNVLIYGASTSVGLYAAQLLRLADTLTNSKIRLLGTARSTRHAQLKAEPYGYAELADYRDENWPRQIGTFCGERGVTYALDCISEGSSVGMVASTLGENGRFAVVRSREGKAWKGELSVEPVYGAVWEGLGEAVQYQSEFRPFAFLKTRQQFRSSHLHRSFHSSFTICSCLHRGILQISSPNHPGAQICITIPSATCLEVWRELWMTVLRYWGTEACRTEGLRGPRIG